MFSLQSPNSLQIFGDSWRSSRFCFVPMLKCFKTFRDVRKKTLRYASKHSRCQKRSVPQWIPGFKRLQRFVRCCQTLSNDPKTVQTIWERSAKVLSHAYRHKVLSQQPFLSQQQFRIRRIHPFFEYSLTPERCLRNGCGAHILSCCRVDCAQQLVAV